jgi:hypothetical protein
MHAARDIAAKMQHEQGVKSAVASFHKNLPQGLAKCDLMSDFPASWRYCDGERRYRLSKVAAEMLVSHKVIEPSRLKPYVPSLSFIDAVPEQEIDI